MEINGNDTTNVKTSVNRRKKKKKNWKTKKTQFGQSASNNHHVCRQFVYFVRSAHNDTI